MKTGWKARHPELAHLPELEAEEDLKIVLAGSDFILAKPGDGEQCAIALGCKRQLFSPLVCIQRSVAYVCLPGPKRQRSGKQLGEEVEGYPGKWVIYRYALGADAREAIIGVDTQNITPTSAMITLKKTAGTSHTRVKKAESVRKTMDKEKRGLKPKRRKRIRKDELTLAGVRNYRGKGG